MPIIVTISFILIIRFKFNIFFISKRIGQYCKIFNMIKFRSYVVDHIELEDKKSQPVLIGKIIRRLSIDEIPQLINVLYGQMSIVGPRPLPPILENQINVESKKIIRSILPGITGLSQIKYSGKNRTVKQKIKYDIIYAKNISLKLYYYILINTIPIIFKRFAKNKKGVSN